MDERKTLSAEQAWEVYLNEQKYILGMPGLMARPSFLAGYRAALAATQAEPIYQIGSERIANLWADVTYDRYASWTYSPKRIVYAAPESSEKEPDNA